MSFTVCPKTVTLETAAKKCFITCPSLGSVNATWVPLTKAIETKASAIAVITGVYWVLKLIMDLESPVEASVTFRLELYFPAM